MRKTVSCSLPSDPAAILVMFMGLTLVFSIRLFATPVVVADPSDVNSELVNQYRGQTLFLRHALTADSQEYDVNGVPLTNRGEGPWSLYGQIQVARIEADSNQLRLEGKRVYYPGGATQMENVKVVADLAGPLSSVDEAAAVLSRVFALTSEEKVKSAPPYWREYLAKQLHVAIPQGSTLPDTDPVFAEALSHPCSGRRGVPKPLPHREAEFTMAARLAKYGGTVRLSFVVDTRGKVSSVSIVNPLGMGLDESAVANAYEWKFVPGTCDGKPASMQMFSEVDFHWY